MQGLVPASHRSEVAAVAGGLAVVTAVATAVVPVVHGVWVPASAAVASAAVVVVAAAAVAAAPAPEVHG